MNLDELNVGETGEVVKVMAKGPFKKRLLEMGFITGAPVKVIKYAPLKDPVEFELKGYHVSLRHEEAQQIEVRKIG